MRRLLGICLLALSGCATLHHGPLQHVQVRTIPSGAQCQAGGYFVTSPGIIPLRRKEAHDVRCSLAGHKDAHARISSDLDWDPQLVLLNVLTGFVPGELVDWGTGSHYALSPDYVELTMRPGTN